MLPFDPAEVIVPMMFFLCVAAIVIVPLWLGHRRRVETQRTLQMAIQQGQQLDAAVVEKLLNSTGGRRGGGGARGGVMTLFAGLGVAAFGFIAGGFDWGQYLMAIGALVGLIGAGQLIAALVFGGEGARGGQGGKSEPEA